MDSFTGIIIYSVYRYRFIFNESLWCPIQSEIHRDSNEDRAANEDEWTYKSYWSNNPLQDVHWGQSWGGNGEAFGHAPDDWVIFSV